MIEDVIRLSPKQWDEVNTRVDLALESADRALGSAGDGQDRAALLLIELQKGLSDIEAMAFAMGLCVGRMSR